MSTSIETLESLAEYYASHNVEKIYIKILAKNDNSKNQIYFGPGFEALNLFQTGEVYPAPNGHNPIFKASVDFSWIGDNRALFPAPRAQIILYPQYPEIRFSGFLLGADRKYLSSIRELMNQRTSGRILCLGSDRNGRVIGAVFPCDSAIANEFSEISPQLTKASEIFYEFLPSVYLGVGTNPRLILLNELGRIYHKGWIESKRLDRHGVILPCTATQCGGYTLEAELGIIPNGKAEPDFHGWEVKQHSGSVITLMTPEPTGGEYVEHGVERFVREYGYPDQSGIANRMNFGGLHYFGEPHQRTSLTLTLIGYDDQTGKITDADGGLALVASNTTIVAFWAFSHILTHWKKKHNSAVYVRSENRKKPLNQYRYRNSVKLGEGTDSLRFLKAINNGAVYYDPGIKLENMLEKPTVKRRSQFRIKLRDINQLYESVTDIDVSSYGI